MSLGDLGDGRSLDEIPEVLEVYEKVKILFISQLVTMIWLEELSNPELIDITAEKIKTLL